MRFSLLLAFPGLMISASPIHGPPPLTGPVDLVLVDKSERMMWLMSGPRTLRQYRIALGGNPVGHKEREGDERTPEGRYLLDWRNPDSCCHKSMHVSYPNEADKAAAKVRGVDPGGLIMIHGQINGTEAFQRTTQLFDWTNGCIAVTNQEMDEIWDLVADNTPIEIRP